MDRDPAVVSVREEGATEIATHDEPLKLKGLLKSAFSSLQAKDWLLVIPLLASCLAITFELGSFWPLGSDAFALFSLSDHLLWAIRVLPLALFGSVGGLAGLLFVLAFDRKQSVQKATPERKSLIAPRFRAAAFVLAIAVLNLLLQLYLGGLDSATSILATVFIPFLFMLMALVPEWVRYRVLLTNALLLLAAISLVFAWGCDNTSQMLASKRLSTFDFGNNNIKKAVLVRSGERGLLIYDPENRELFFTKMEELKNFKWQRGRMPWEDKKTDQKKPS